MGRRVVPPPPPPGVLEVEKVSLPRGSACDSYRIKMESASW